MPLVHSFFDGLSYAGLTTSSTCSLQQTVKAAGGASKAICIPSWAAQPRQAIARLLYG